MGRFGRIVTVALLAVSLVDSVGMVRNGQIRLTVNTALAAGSMEEYYGRDQGLVSDRAVRAGQSSDSSLMLRIRRTVRLSWHVPWPCTP